ncbi:TonB-dependent receptor [Sphingomonas sp. S1-29]|uniref:TonB-dependent receptor n=1 Tax=Sphingomonas sp. S1-29 TaxID=2991074 RepID=UPI00223F6977|nr:TonB-dependent receptor [Sphingomonas sp. S1-29]UZK69066.1 TonB-dependent receptor [Sphingomonas sp. S1-29]
MTILKRRLCRSAALALALSAVVTAGAAQAQTQQRRVRFNIAAQPMDRALEQLARQSGSDILFTRATVARLNAPALSGEFAAEAAVRRLIAGQPLSVTRDAAGALIVRPQPAAARQTPAVAPTPVASDQAADEQDIVITAKFSAGVERSLDVKRNADSISDAIVAADIGKLPAFNIAEALQRVPGVTIVREAGEGQFISVRGLGPNFQAVTFDGMPLAYNENIRNSGQSGRQFRLQVLPATLIDSIVVIKSPTADLVENGIGSTVDIRLLNPLDRDPFVAANFFGGYEERTDTLNPNGSLSAGWHNADNSFGVLGGISYSKREVQFDRLRVGWQDLEVPGYGEIRAPGDAQPYLELEDRERISAVAGIQWRPTPNLEFDIDGLYSQFNNETIERRLTYYIPSQIARLDPATAVVEDGRLVAGTIRGARIRNYAEYLDQSHRNLQLNATMRLDLDGWRFEPRFSYAQAKSDLDTPIQRVQYRTANNRGGDLTFDFSGDVLDRAKINSLFTTLDLTDPSLMPFESFAVRPINSRDEDKTLVLNVSRDTAFDLGGLQITRIAYGGQYSDRYRDYQRRDRSTTALRDGVTRTGDFLGAPVPSNAFDQSIGTFQPWTNVDWGLFNQSYVLRGEFDGVNPSAYDLEPNAADRQNSYRIDEEIVAGYGRIDFASDAGAVPVRGNVGLRYVRTATDVDGTIVSPVRTPAGGVTTEVTPITTTASYEEWLPSANANFSVADNIQLRLGAARTMTRPSLSELRNSINTNSVTVTNIFNLGAAALADETINLNASAGNPNLRPYTSWNLDLSFEWYFDKFGAFTAAAFYKDVSDYIAADFETRTLAFAVNDGSTLPVDVLVSTPTNVGDATISGIEFGYTNRLSFGLGVTATATFATSKLELDLAGVGVQSAGVQGVSDVSYSITPFFESGPFELNLSYTYRSQYMTDAGALVTSLPTADDVVAFYQDGFGILDLGGSYQIRPNVEAFVQATNVLDSRQVSFAGSRDEFTEIHTFGRTVNFGVRAKF